MKPTTKTQTVTDAKPTPSVLRKKLTRGQTILIGIGLSAMICAIAMLTIIEFQTARLESMAALDQVDVNSAAYLDLCQKFDTLKQVTIGIIAFCVVWILLVLLPARANPKSD